MPLPVLGRPADEVLAALEAMRHDDVGWKDGRAFSLAYYAGPEVHAVATAALAAFASENCLNLDAFPSLRHMQNEVLATMAELLGGDEDCVGVFTSGGETGLLGLAFDPDFRVAGAGDDVYDHLGRRGCCRRHPPSGRACGLSDSVAAFAASLRPT